MSAVFELDPRGWEALVADAQANPLDLSRLRPAPLENAASAIGQGVMRGGARVAQFVGMAAAAPAVLYAKAADAPELVDPYFRKLDELVTDAVDYWTPSAQETGTIGRIFGGLAEIVLPLMAGGGNPTLLLGSQQMGIAMDLARQGVDSDTAVGVGAVQGAATAVGFRLPYLGKTLASRIGSGIGGNLATSMSAAAVSREVLRSQGFNAQAQSFDPLDVEARAIDVLTGAVFGGLAHLATPTQRAAAAGAMNARNFQADSAPGRAADLEASAAHQSALGTALKQLSDGEPVNVPAAVADAKFVDTPARAAQRAQIADAILAEMRQLEEAYGEVLARPRGPADDPLVRIQPEDIEAVVVARGGWRGKGDVEVKGSGWGLAKFIWRHGEGSDKAPAYQVGREDVLAFPSVIREFEPSRAAAADGSLGREWRISRPGADGASRTVVYADNLIEGRSDRHLVTVYVQEPGLPGTDAALSRGIDEPGVPRPDFGGPARIPPADFRSSQQGSGPPAGSAPAQSSVPAGGAEARGETAESVVVRAAREAVAAPEATVPIDQFDADGRPQVERAADVLARADDAVKRAQTDAQGFLAAVTCFLSLGGR
ncbi:MAG: hypothetical protein IT518_20270 [Burkholderiales bacterium]|nr:hypothetical protein [Burkholderiales bacterium]